MSYKGRKTRCKGLKDAGKSGNLDGRSCGPTPIAINMVSSHLWISCSQELHGENSGMASLNCQGLTFSTENVAKYSRPILVGVANFIRIRSPLPWTFCPEVSWFLMCLCHILSFALAAVADWKGYLLRKLPAFAFLPEKCMKLQLIC